MAMLDAKLASALSHFAPPDFQRALQARKAEAMKTGKMLAGRQILLMVDQHFKMSEMDNSVYEAEHFFSIKKKCDRLQEFVTTWDQVLSGIDKTPDDQTLRAFMLCNLRHCKALEQDLAFYDRLPPGHENNAILTFSAQPAPFSSATVFTGTGTSLAVPSVALAG